MMQVGSPSESPTVPTPHSPTLRPASVDAQHNLYHFNGTQYTHEVPCTNNTTINGEDLARTMRSFKVQTDEK